MKKAIVILLALILLLSLSACGGDKGKLIGRYSSHEEYITRTGYFSVFNAAKRNLVFFPDGTFYYQEEILMSVGSLEGTGYMDLDPIRSGGTGRYQIADGFVTLSGYDGEGALPDELTAPIPYGIDAETGELVFAVKEDGWSDWKKVSKVPTIPEFKDPVVPEEATETAEPTEPAE